MSGQLHTVTQNVVQELHLADLVCQMVDLLESVHTLLVTFSRLCIIIFKKIFIMVIAISSLSESNPVI